MKISRKALSKDTRMAKPNEGLYQRNVRLAGIGWVHVKSDGKEILSVDFRKRNVQNKSHVILEKFSNELQKYARGKAHRLNQFRPHMQSYTPFQRKVLHKLFSLPSNRLTNYTSLARAIGRPRSARAVGNAVGKNRTPILIPCHRVICANGSLGGFSGGLSVKRRLLRSEKLL